MATTGQQCASCGAANAASRCSGCKSVYFCNIECQRKAWPDHKRTCQSQRESPARPSTIASVAVSASLPSAVFPPATPSAAPAKDPTALLASQSLRHLSDLVSNLADEAKSDHRLSHIPEGTFRELMTRPGAFAQLVYPGVNPRDLEGDISGRSPLTLKQLFASELLSDARQAAALRACEKGRAIIESVKMKAIKAGGPRMDEATERQLWPQVFAEAFCREIPSIVTVAAASPPGTASASATSSRARPDKVARRTRAPKVTTAATAEEASASAIDMMASPFHVLAASSYLSEETLSSLFARTNTEEVAKALLEGSGSQASTIVAPSCSSSSFPAVPSPLAPLRMLRGGFAEQRGPFSGDPEEVDAWCALITDDCLRMAEEEARWSAPIRRRGRIDLCQRHPSCPSLQVTLETSSRYAWLNDGELEDEAPAISEALQRLHALPFELCRKIPGLRLQKPRPGTALLRHFHVKAEVNSVSIAARTAQDQLGSKTGAQVTAMAPLTISIVRDDADEGKAKIVAFPHGEDFVCNAPADKTPVDDPSSSSLPVQLTAICCSGKHSDKKQKGGVLPAVPSAKLILDLVPWERKPPGAVDAAAEARLNATASNTLLLHRSQSLHYRPEIELSLKLPSETTMAGAATLAHPSPAILESHFFLLCTFIRGPADDKFGFDSDY